MIIEDENLNIEFETTEEENFIKACDLCSKKLTREDLFQYLKIRLIFLEIKMNENYIMKYYIIVKNLKILI